MTTAHHATAIAHPNIALIKYWGKRDVSLNLPGAPSLSLTLDGLHTRTEVTFDETLHEDRIELDGALLPAKKAARLVTFLDRVRQRADLEWHAHVITANDFPTSAGLASSASGFAALALAATTAAGLTYAPAELSVLARLGSGSAARSIFGGWVHMHAGAREDGTDAHAEQIAPVDHWDLRCLVAVCAQGPKEIGSTEAMQHTADTSPYYEPWIADVPQTLKDARDALKARNFTQLANVAEASCLRMHASAMAADPGILYWKGITVEVIHAIRHARRGGLPVFFTIDAGPHIKAFCPAEAEEDVAQLLRSVDGVLDVLHARPGRGARLVEE